MDGASNGGYSFLLMSLWNHTLKLTDEQKENIKSFLIENDSFKLGDKINEAIIKYALKVGIVICLIYMCMQLVNGQKVKKQENLKKGIENGYYLLSLINNNYKQI